MTKLKLLSAALLVCGVTLAANAAQDTAKTDDAAMAPPKPIENKVYDAMIGTWQGDSEMAGKKMHDVLKIRWALNHQFLIMELKATNTEQPKMKYEGMGVFGVDAQGKAKTVWFDSWGADAMSIGSGTFSNNKLEMSDSNSMFKEIRSFEMKGNNMVMHAKGTMNMNGKETPFEQNTVYQKK